MFEYLPIVSFHDGLEMVKKDTPYFEKLVQQCMKQTDIGSEALECACNEITKRSPGLGVAVEGHAQAMVIALEGYVGEREAWISALASLAGELAILRLIDRALEAKGLERE